MKKLCFSLPIINVLVFIAVVSWYIDTSTPHVGVYPIGVISGICILSQLIMCCITVKNIIINYYRIRSIIFLSLEVCSIIVMGYLFFLWLLII